MKSSSEYFLIQPGYPPFAGRESNRDTKWLRLFMEVNLMSKRGIALCLTAFVLFTAIAANAQEKSFERTISERFIGSIDFSKWIRGTFELSPDGKQVAYTARLGDKQLAVVDGKEGKQYDGIGTFIFSPDGRRVTYCAQLGDKWLVVVDGVEGKRYDVISMKIIFDTSTSFHYYACKDNSVYLVEEKIE